MLVLAVLVVLNAASEWISFSRVIDRGAAAALVRRARSSSGLTPSVVAAGKPRVCFCQKTRVARERCAELVG